MDDCLRLGNNRPRPPDMCSPHAWSFSTTTIFADVCRAFGYFEYKGALVDHYKTNCLLTKPAR